MELSNKGNKTNFLHMCGRFTLLAALFFCVLGAKGQEPVVITSDTNGNGVIDDNEKNLYLIQTNAFQSFYIAPQSNNTITTNNILGDYMLWYFLDAGSASGVQYYHIVNYSTDQYIYNHDGNSRGISLISSTEFANLSNDNKEKCKFKLVLNESNGTTGFYNIDVKASQTYYGLNKRNGSMANTYPIRLTNSDYINDINSKWKFIPYNGTFTWPAPPFTISTDSDKHYYKIHNVEKTAYYISTDETPDKVTYASTESYRMIWYFEEAPDDPSTPWFKYYYIVNPKSGKYMYYDGTAATTGNDQTDAVIVKTYDSGNEDRYQFVVVQAARGDGDNRVECYAIIPKLLREVLWKSSSLGLKDTDISDGAHMGIINSRGSANTAQWKMEEIQGNLVETPVISFDNETGLVSMSCNTPGANIHYTIGQNPEDPTTGSTQYTDPIQPVSSCTIKAIGAIGQIVSEVETLELEQVATPTFSLNPANNEVTITSTSGASIYYSIGAEDPIIGVNPYTEPFVLPYNQSGQPVKAIARKGGMIDSNMGSETFTLYCLPPTITFANTNNFTSNEVTLACADAGATMYYTTTGADPEPGQVGTIQYNAPFAVSTACTVKAIAVHANYNNSVIAELSIHQVDTPTIQNNGSNAVSITCDTVGVTIYYAIGGNDPVIGSPQVYSEPLREGVSGQTVKAIAVKEGLINSAIGSNAVTLRCEGVAILRDGTGFMITCDFPSSGVTIYYETASVGNTPNPPTHSSSSTTPGTHINATLPITVSAIAAASNYDDSDLTTATILQDLSGSGTIDDPYLIEAQYDVPLFVDKVNSAAGASAYYKVTATTLNFSSVSEITQPFSGNFDGNFCIITDLGNPFFTTVAGGTVRNVILKEVEISEEGDVGAICRVANGQARIYNCGILPTDPIHIAENPSTVASSNNHNCGSLVGLLDGYARVINCFSYAWITRGGGGDYYVGGIVGNNNQSSTQSDIKTIVVNCMFYGDINTANCAKYFPVYGNKVIKTEDNNHNSTGINPYDFFRESASFDNTYSGIDAYNRSWPVLEEYLTRFEYYRSIFNSNRRLCTWWVDGVTGTAPVDADIKRVGIAKWVLDPGIAPYPILKKWDKYYSIINPDPEKVWDTATGAWVQRANANPYQGKSLGTLSITVNPGGHASSGVTGTTITRTITDMDTLHFDYGYYKVQLPYYNELFGDPSSDDHDTRYGGNYKDYVVTGWKITSVTGGTQGSFEAQWEHGYNFADRYCTDKDKYDVSGRVFAQGGYYYVPEGVSAITIEAYWGKAVYLHNTGHYLDRVDITNYTASGTPRAGQPFTPSGTLPTSFQNQDVKDSWKSAVLALDQASVSNNALNISVYDQAIVLLNNLQWRNENDAVGTGINGGTKWYPYTIMSIDEDLDNEPDYCFEFQFRKEWVRPGIQPIRFDFLPVPELGMAVRHGKDQNTIGIFVPQGHFEITETSYMHTTQFEYDGQGTGSGNGYCGPKVPAPIILNGGHFEQIVVRYGPQNTTQYILMGGHFRMLRFTPGAHTATAQSAKVRLCAVNAIGGEYPEFYLSGIYRPDITPESVAKQGNPHCYINGGKFDLIAGAGYDKILGSVYFKIDHSIIGEFYGGGINGSKPIGGNIDVTIDHSLVGKYCGGPKVGPMEGQTVTTHATGTTFTKFYGGGNGGTSYYRETKQDGNVALPAATAAGWANYGYKTFNPLNTISGVDPSYQGTGDKKGYHALFEFECFVESNGLGQNPTVRSYLHWAQFGTTTTGDVTNTLTNCTIKESFYGGGNLANVNGDVTSTLTDCTILGNVFGGGYSGKIEPFRIHDKSQAHFPYIDGAGLMQDGLNRLNSLEYIDREYTWCYRKSQTEFLPEGVVIPSTADTGANATFEYPVGSGKWYVLTTVSLEHLGAVSGNVTLTLVGTTNGITEVGTVGDDDTGDVFGGGNESDVDGSTTVELQGNTRVRGDVFGGGNVAPVGGNTSVTIEIYTPSSNPGGSQPGSGTGD